MFCRKHTICLVSLKYREIVTVKIVTLYNTLQLFFIDSLKNKKKKLAINSFFMSVKMYGWEIQSNQDSTFLHTLRNSKMFNITTKYFSFFNKKTINHL